ncbi:prolipoprotein diacylglyceryl transferase [Nocardioides daphniae]|uniref:Phosphatidylglycerol--prolipoprotein diacylglyceryl transferase n=1 Tax=Nocardioides daphniae TaxID=402297 RepID=A0A4V1CWF1_9ACTN|nr:prolipoprotein diacylglyceryl transferase [Nocardioides daphniae]QCC77047.1 prolipoprotein diacylglyceryl transferase [Nocardioides daphniae]GGD18999.1 prolipoprotein diacylglyceryl transferase 1 [Nocardioides daphniae]
MLSQLVALAIPSPDQGVWHLGPVPLRAYALCIILGVVVAVWMGERRWVARGGQPGDVQDLALWAVPFGLVGGRLYHVVTDHQLYFGDGNDPITALYVWRGGLGIWGAIALGALGVVIGARLKGIKVLPFLDALAPGVLLAQGIGRWGNWFNQELYGRPTDLPWGLEIDDAHRPYDYVGADVVFHPTFLYESLWALAGCLLLLWLDRRRRFAPGQLVALYVMVYTAGRVWIENLRIDSVQYDDLLGLRLNSWTSILLFAVALVCFWLLRRRAAQEGAAAPASAVGDGGPEPAGSEKAVDAEPGDDRS